MQLSHLASSLCKARAAERTVAGPLVRTAREAEVRGVWRRAEMSVEVRSLGCPSQSKCARSCRGGAFGPR